MIIVFFFFLGPVCSFLIFLHGLGSDFGDYTVLFLIIIIDTSHSAHTYVLTYALYFDILDRNIIISRVCRILSKGS